MASSASCSASKSEIDDEMLDNLRDTLLQDAVTQRDKRISSLSKTLFNRSMELDAHRKAGLHLVELLLLLSKDPNKYREPVALAIRQKLANKKIEEFAEALDQMIMRIDAEVDIN